jgi:hypothetical protein
VVAERADHERTADGAADAGTERRRGRRARSGATGPVKTSRRMPDRKREPAAEATPAKAAAAAAPEPVAAAATTPSQPVAEPVAAAVQASQALAAAPAVAPEVMAVPQLWPSVALRAGQAALESSLRLQQETFAFAAAQAARNWKAGQALARCGSLPAALAVQRELIEQTMAHGSTCLGAFSRLTAEAVQAALPPPHRR